MLSETSMNMDRQPPFPDDIATCPVLKLSLANLAAKREDEYARLFTACSRDGFFMLDFSDTPEHAKLLGGVRRAFDLSETYFHLDDAEKLKHKMDSRALGYKPMGHLKSKRKIDHGKGDMMEMFTLSSAKLHDPVDEDFPQLMVDHRQQLSDLSGRLECVARQLLDDMSHVLHISPTLLENAHRIDARSKTSLRFLYSPAQQKCDEQRRFSLPGHQDHGSLAILFNILGGLQVLPPGVTEDEGEDAWLWVKPDRNCATVILGSPFGGWTGGLFRPAFHRVLYPPGEQSLHDRYSLGLFMKPCDDVSLKRFPGSDLIPPPDEEDQRSEKSYADWHAGSVVSYNSKPDVKA